MSLRTRLEKLEANSNGSRADKSGNSKYPLNPIRGDREIRHKFFTAVFEFFDSLNEDHRRIIETDIENLFIHTYNSPFTKRADYPTLANLTSAFAGFMIDVVADHYTGPVTMPPVIAEHYVNASSYTAHYRCAKCYYPVPGKGSPLTMTPVVESCPVCNGKVEASGGRGGQGCLSRLEIENGLAFLYAENRQCLIFDTMSEEDRETVTADIKAMNEECRKAPGIWVRPQHTTSLLTGLLLYIFEAHGPKKVYYLLPPTYPPEVTEIVKRYQSKRTICVESDLAYADNCEDCGYPSPGYSNNSGKFRLWNPCIICGGAIGGHAYEVKHNHPGIVFEKEALERERAKGEPIQTA